MAFDRLLTRDPITRIRLLRQLMGAGSYVMFMLPGLLAVHWGWTAFGYAGLFALLGVALAVNAGFFVLIRSGVSRRFADPTLLVPQILAAITLAIVTMHYMRSEARSIMLMLYVAMFFFGLFGLTTRRFLVLAAVAVGGYAVLIAAEHSVRPLGVRALRMEVLRLVALLMITVWLSFVGGYFARLRSKLAERKEALQEALARVKDLSERDELTGARNRRYLMHALDREKARAARFDQPFCVAIIDLDHFKHINDRYGHAVGDEILRGFCDFVRGQARELDLLARQDVDEAFGRYGGEEFLLVLPHTALDGALRCLHRIHAAVGSSRFETATGALTVGFSAGVAQYRPDESVSALLGRADEALYRAKSRGRNSVESA